MKRVSKKYVEVTINFPGEQQQGDEQMHFCIDGASEHKAATLSKEIAEKTHPGKTYSGWAERKNK